MFHYFLKNFSIKKAIPELRIAEKAPLTTKPAFESRQKIALKRLQKDALLIPYPSLAGPSAAALTVMLRQAVLLAGFHLLASLPR